MPRHSPSAAAKAAGTDQSGVTRALKSRAGGRSQVDIFDRIYRAIVEHRLVPGTKLAEERVAEVFSVSRTQVRGALQRLAASQLVTLVPNRGAFVATPTPSDAQDVLEARKLIEPKVIERVVANVRARGGKALLARLVAHLEKEEAARLSGDRHASVRLSGEFHVLLAELSGSSIFANMMRELTPLTCLAILAFQAPTGTACRDDEHEQIVAAIQAGETPLACRRMLGHLKHIELSLQRAATGNGRNDLIAALLG